MVETRIIKGRIDSPTWKIELTTTKAWLLSLDPSINDNNLCVFHFDIFQPYCFRSLTCNGTSCGANFEVR